MVVCLVFNSLSTLMGHLMLNPVIYDLLENSLEVTLLWKESELICLHKNANTNNSI